MSWWLSQHSQARLTSSWHFHTEIECRALPSLWLTLSNSFQHHLQINAFIKLQGLHWWSDIKINRCLLSYYNEELVLLDYIHYCKWFTSYKSLIWGFTYFSFGWQCYSYCSCYFGDESLEHLTYVEWINITRHAEKSCPVCQVPLAKGNSEFLVPSVSIPTCTHHPEPSWCHPSLRARAPSWVQLSRSPWILADPRQVRILPYPGMISLAGATLEDESQWPAKNLLLRQWRRWDTLKMWQPETEWGWASCVLNLLLAVPERGNPG